VDETRWPGPPEGSSEASPSGQRHGTGCPVFVMLPLDTVWVVERDGKKVCVRVCVVYVCDILMIAQLSDLIVSL